MENNFSSRGLGFCEGLSFGLGLGLEPRKVVFGREPRFATCKGPEAQSNPKAAGKQLFEPRKVVFGLSALASKRFSARLENIFRARKSCHKQKASCFRLRRLNINQPHKSKDRVCRAELRRSGCGKGMSEPEPFVDQTQWMYGSGRF